MYLWKEDLLITVFLERKISILGCQFLHVQFEWNMVRDLCLLEAQLHKSQYQLSFSIFLLCKCNVKLQHILRN